PIPPSPSPPNSAILYSSHSIGSDSDPWLTNIEQVKKFRREAGVAGKMTRTRSSLLTPSPHKKICYGARNPPPMHIGTVQESLDLKFTSGYDMKLIKGGKFEPGAKSI
ncbi:hypothetical protein LINPERHAP1_LOCUS4242, partial [Linum perenne]